MKIFKKVRGGGGGDKKATDKNALKSPRGTEGGCDLDNIWGEVESMVGEPLRALPVHKDLHRLAPTTYVILSYFIAIFPALKFKIKY